jgi:hypothetical protein
MGLVFGEVDATAKPDLSFPPTREQVLLHDHAGTGFPSWDVLINGGAPQGVVSFNGQGLEIISPDVSSASPNGQAFGAAALNRFSRPSTGLKVYLIWDWKFRVFRSNNGVYSYTKGLEFGLDTADFGTAGTGGSGLGGLEPVSANRTLCMARCALYDEAGVYYGGKWQMNAGAASAPAMTDLKDLSNNLISPTVAGYERLMVGMNYGKWMRQKTEMVIDLTPQVVAVTPLMISVTNASTAATFTGTTPISGAPVIGTSVPIGTFVASTGSGTLVLSQAATATTATLAGASCSGATVVARLEGLRHNGVGFGSLAIGSTGYSTDMTANPRAQELTAQQAVANGSGILMPAISQDAGFQGGLNVYAQIDNRSSQPSKGKLLITRCRVGVFS